MGSIPGGDGTTNNTTGATRAYASLSEAESNEQAAFNGDNLVITCALGGGSLDTTSVTINGSTFNSSADYMTIESNAVSDARGETLDTGKYVLDVTDSNAMTIFDDYVRIMRMQIRLSGVDANSEACINAAALAAGAEIYVCESILQGANEAGTNSVCIYANDTDADFYIANNVCYDTGARVSSDNSPIRVNCNEAWVYNNTIIEGYRGIRQEGGTVYCINNLVYNQGGSATLGAFDASSDYNSTDDTTICNDNTNDRVSQTFTFKAAGSDNYNLTVSDTGALDLGTDLSGDANLPVTVDTIGTARPQNSVYDIGAFELIQAAGVSIPVLMRSYRNRRVS
jgi:hypothetical protein